MYPMTSIFTRRKRVRFETQREKKATLKIHVKTEAEIGIILYRYKPRNTEVCQDARRQA